MMDEIPEEAYPFLVHRLGESNDNSSDNKTNTNNCAVSPESSTPTKLVNTDFKRPPDVARSSGATGDDVTPPGDCDGSDEETNEAELPFYQKFQHLCSTVSEYMEKEPEEYFTPYLVQEKFFRRFWVMDIVKYYMKNTCCFTKR